MTIPMISFNPPPRRESLLERLLAIGAATAIQGAVGERYDKRREQRASTEWDRQQAIAQEAARGLAQTQFMNNLSLEQYREDAQQEAFLEQNYVPVTDEILANFTDSGLNQTDFIETYNGKQYVKKAVLPQIALASPEETHIANVLGRQVGLENITERDTRFTANDYSQLLNAAGQLTSARQTSAMSRAQIPLWEQVFYRGPDQNDYKAEGLGRLKIMGPEGLRPLKVEERNAYWALKFAKQAARDGDTRAQKFVEQWSYLEDAKAVPMIDSDMLNVIMAPILGVGSDASPEQRSAAAAELFSLELSPYSLSTGQQYELNNLTGMIHRMPELVEAYAWSKLVFSPQELAQNTNNTDIFGPTSPIVKGWLQQIYYRRLAQQNGYPPPDHLWRIPGAVNPPEAPPEPGKVGSARMPLGPNRGPGGDVEFAIPPSEAEAAGPIGQALINQFSMRYAKNLDAYHSDTTSMRAVLAQPLTLVNNPEQASLTINQMMVWMEGMGAGTSDEFKVLSELSRRAKTDEAARRSALQYTRTTAMAILDAARAGRDEALKRSVAVGQ